MQGWWAWWVDGGVETDEMAEEKQQEETEHLSMWELIFNSSDILIGGVAYRELDCWWPASNYTLVHVRSASEPESKKMNRPIRYLENDIIILTDL